MAAVLRVIAGGLGAVSFSFKNVHRFVLMPIGNQTAIKNDYFFFLFLFLFFLNQQQQKSQPQDHRTIYGVTCKVECRERAPPFMGTEASRVEFISTAPSANT